MMGLRKSSVRPFSFESTEVAVAKTLSNFSQPALEAAEKNHVEAELKFVWAHWPYSRQQAPPVASPVHTCAAL
jgi:hypothetical protein